MSSIDNIIRIIGLSGCGLPRNGPSSSCILANKPHMNHLSMIDSSSSHNRCGKARNLLNILCTWDLSSQGNLQFHNRFPWVWSWGDSQYIVLFGIWHTQFAFSCKFLEGSGSIRTHKQRICNRCTSCSFGFCSLRFQVCMVCNIPCRHGQLHSCIPRWSSWHRCCCRD